MNVETRCKHEMVRAFCALCRNIKTPEEQALEARAELLKLPGWFEAKYPGHCASCGEFFPIGAAITRDPVADPPVYIAECCPEVATWA